MKTRVYYEEIDAIPKLYAAIYKGLKKKENRDLVVLCIGTDRSSGDSLGPLIGTKLTEKALQHFQIYGTLEHPVHALNLKDTVLKIKSTYPHPYIIAVDACLGKEETIGVISYQQGPIFPGLALNKKLASVGDAHIVGIVNRGGGMDFHTLQNTRLFTVMNMAEVIAEGISYTDARLRMEKIPYSM